MGMKDKAMEFLENCACHEIKDAVGERTKILSSVFGVHSICMNTFELAEKIGGEFFT